MRVKYFLWFCGLLFAVQTSIAYASDTLKLSISTKKGNKTVLIRLFPEIAPNHVKRIKQLVKEGAYNRSTFHRVLPGFMAQTGDIAYGNKDNYDVLKVGTGDSDHSDLYAELSAIPFKRGIVGMARNRYIHSANSQFFIMKKYHPDLNGRYTVIGQVTKGLEYIQLLKAGVQGRQQGKVENPDYIISAEIID